MTPIAWVGLAVAGGLGAAARLTVDARVTAAARRRAARTGRERPDAVPLGTITVNLTACFLLGLLSGATAAGPSWMPGALSGLWPQIRVIAGTGFLGGYSTFSTASLEGARLLASGRGGGAAAHALALTAGALAAAVVGTAVGRALA